jgi:23S rRNA-/tRNA-specific pseudouridylate synthase
LPEGTRDKVKGKNNNIKPLFHNPKSSSIVKISLEILTWRTHQIRYHLSSKWLPIIGDWLYGDDENNEIQLTAYKLIFTDPDWERISLEI